MRLEFINKVREKDILGKSILTSEGQVLLKAGVELSDNYINKLRKLGVFYLYVEDERLGDVEVEDEKLTELKQFTIRSMSNILANIHDCNGKKVVESLTGVEDMISYIIEIGDINKSLYDIKTYDNYTFIHSVDVCIMASFLGVSAGYDDYSLNEVGIGAALHDVGKTKIPTSILNKKDKLTEEEFREIKKHPIYGSQLLKKNVSISNNIIKTVEQHHERVDGRGYPYGLSSKQIAPSAKLVCICDVYDAVSSDRCYRKKFRPNEAYELILSGSGSSFDQSMVSYFKNTFAIYPLGCCVKLSNGVEGYVIRQNRGFPDRPAIRVLYNSKTREAVPSFEVDLIKNTDLVISSIV